MSDFLQPQAQAPMLNDLWGEEHLAYFFYRAASTFMSLRGYPYAAAFMDKEAAEELEHAKKLEGYMQLRSIPLDSADLHFDVERFTGFGDVLRRAHELESALGVKYDRYCRESFKSDMSMFNLLLTFVDIQAEAEGYWRGLLDRLAQIDENDAAAIQEFEEQMFSEPPTPL